MAVLISLLLPAVQQAREAARRIQCTNNLKQLTLGTLNYEQANGALPRSGIVERKFKEYGSERYEVYDQHSGKMFSWVVQALPYMEQQPLFDQFDLDRTVLEQPSDPQATFVDSLMCPSDASEGRYYQDDEYTNGKRFAKGNYAAYVSPMHGDLQLLYPAAFTSAGQRLKRVIDGTSHTIALAEVRTADFLDDERGVWALPWNGATQLSMDMHTYKTDSKNKAQILERYDLLRYASNQSQVPNSQGGHGDVLVRCSTDHLAGLQLEDMPCIKHQWTLGIFGYISAAPRSLHPGGVNVSYLDGRVEFLADDINPVYMSYLVGIQDGEIPTYEDTKLSGL